MILNLALIDYIEKCFNNGIAWKEKPFPASYPIEQSEYPDLVLEALVINDGVVALSINGVVTDPEANLKNDIVLVLIQLIHDQHDCLNVISDMVNDLTALTHFESPIGLTFSCYHDYGHQCVMVKETKNPTTVLYALEQAVNIDMGISEKEFVSFKNLEDQIFNIFAAYILNNQSSFKFTL